MASEKPGPGTRNLFRTAAVVAIAVFVFLTGYFMLYGPLEEEPPSNPAAGGNPEVIEQATPPKTPDRP